MMKWTPPVRRLAPIGRATRPAATTAIAQMTGIEVVPGTSSGQVSRGS